MTPEILILLIINLLFIIFYKYVGKIVNIYDSPDSIRKFHKEAIPLVGGFILISNIFILIILNIFIDQSYISKSFFLFYRYSLISFFICPFIIFLIGMYDDRFNLDPTKKLLFTAIVVTFGVLSDPNLVIENLKFEFIDYEFNLNRLNQAFTILCILLFINAFNMLDGINLLAGLYSLFLFSIIYFFKVPDPFIALFSLAIFTYLILNAFNKIFLGDSGTLLLGYLLATVTIFSYNVQDKFFPEEVFFLMLFPGLEILRLSLTRIVNEKNAFSPDRNHLHHLLLARFGYLFSLSLILSLIVIPNLLYYMFNFDIITLIFSTVIIYLFLIIYLKYY